MSSSVKPRRRYESPRRLEQARQTRRSILAAARDLFVEHGYVTTTIQAVADRAGVSAATVYAAFGNKRTLLGELLDVSIAGDDVPVAVLDRAWVDDLRREPELGRRLRLLARNGRAILERRGPIDEVLRTAAATDPEIGALWEHSREQRRIGQAHLLRLVAGDHGLRDGLSWSEAGDTLYAIGSSETYRLLVIDRGWSAPRFERWYAETLRRLLFA